MKKHFFAYIIALCLCLCCVTTAAAYTNDELCDMARQYYKDLHGYEPPLVEVNRESESGNEVVLHLYEYTLGHTATWDWYILDRITGKGTTYAGKPVDLSPYAPGPRTTADSPLQEETAEKVNIQEKTSSTPATSESAEYIYDVADPGENTKLPTDALDSVTDSASAVNAVTQLTGGMTREQKSSPTGVDLAELYAETAVSMAARKAVDGGEIAVNAASVADLASTAAQTAGTVESALSSGGITTARYLAKTVTLTTNETDISIQVDPDTLTAGVDRVRVETPVYALTLKLADLKEDLTEPLTFRAQEVFSSYALKRTDGKTTVKIDLPKVQMTNPVIVSLPKDSGNITYQAVIRADGTAAASKFNPATLALDGRINTSGTYTVRSNEKNFSDISGKSAEMQKAILYLTSKGIINGTGATEFSPDNSISRQQIAALLMRALGKVDNAATTTFTDVSQSSGLYHAIASSQRHKIINGYSDNTFRGTNVISKSQIVTVSGRVLTSEMNYKAPRNTSDYLGKYSDSVPDYAQAMVALATREGLVVYRTDGTFSGDKNMTRGEAAIILYRLFQKIW